MTKLGLEKLSTTPQLSAHGLASRSGTARLALVAIAFIVLALGFPVGFLLADGRPLEAVSSLPYWVIVLISAVRLALPLGGVARRLPETVFYLFCYIWLGLAPLLHLQAGHGPLPYSLTPEEYRNAGFLVLLGIFAYEVTRAGVSRRTGKSTGRQPRSRELYLLVWIVIAFSVVMMFVVGGPATLWSSRQEFSAGIYGSGTDKAAGAIISSLLIAPPFVAAAALLHKGRGLAGRLTHYSTLAAAVTVNIVINNPLSQGRFWFTTVWASLLVIFLVRARLPLWWLPLGFVIATLLVFPNADVFRYAGSSLAQFQLVPPGDQLVDKGDFDSIQQIGLGMRYVGERGFLMGQQALSTALFFIPRSIWPDKAIDTGSVLANYVGFGNANLSAPLWIEAYIDGGVLLVAAAFAVLGLVHGRMAAQQTLSLGTVIFAFYQLVLLRGSLLASMATGSVLLVMFLVLTTKGSAISRTDPSFRAVELLGR